MQIPQSLFGSYADVRKACAKAVKGLAQGQGLGAFASDFVSTEEREGLIVLSGPTLTDAHFHMFGLNRAARDQRGLLQAKAAELLALYEAAPWGVLALMDQHAYAFFNRDPGLARHFLERVRSARGEIEQLGARFTMGVPLGARLHELPTNIALALGKLGVGQEQLLAMQRSESLMWELIDQSLSSEAGPA